MAISPMKLNLYFNWLPNIHVLTFCTKLASMHTVIGPVSDFLLSLYTYTNRNTTRLDKGKQFVNRIQLASNIFSSRNVFFPAKSQVWRLSFKAWRTLQSSSEKANSSHCSWNEIKFVENPFQARVKLKKKNHLQCSIGKRDFGDKLSR